VSKTGKLMRAEDCTVRAQITSVIYTLTHNSEGFSAESKIVQRVPVKLTFDRDSIKGYEDLVVAGLSVTPSIDLTTTGDRASKDDPAPLANRNGR